MNNIGTIEKALNEIYLPTIRDIIVCKLYELNIIVSNNNVYGKEAKIAVKIDDEKYIEIKNELKTFYRTISIVDKALRTLDALKIINEEIDFAIEKLIEDLVSYIGVELRKYNLTLPEIELGDFEMQELTNWNWLVNNNGNILCQKAGRPIYTATLVYYAALMPSSSFIRKIEKEKEENT